MNITDDIDLYRAFWVSSSPGSVTGPFTLEQIGGMWRAGQLYATAQICEEGASDWHPVTTLRRDFPEIMSTGRTVSMPVTVSNKATGEKDFHVGTYRVLGLLFGTMGVHNFFAGEICPGLVKLLLFAVGGSVWLFDPHLALFGLMVLLVSAVMALIEVINGGVKNDDPVEIAPLTEEQKRRSMMVLLVSLLLISCAIWFATQWF